MTRRNTVTYQVTSNTREWIISYQISS